MTQPEFNGVLINLPYAGYLRVQVLKVARPQHDAPINSGKLTISKEAPFDRLNDVIGEDR